METILFMAQVEPDGSLAQSSLETLATALKLSQSLAGSQVAVGLVGEKADLAANQVAPCGATKFFAVAGADFVQPRYASDAAATEALFKAAGATLLLAPANSRWNRVMAGVAQRLGGRCDSHVVGVSVANGAVVANRWYYRQRMEGQLQRTTRPWLLLVEPGSQPAWRGEPGVAQVQSVSVALPAQARRTSVIGVREPAADAQTIRPEADLLFVTGAGWTKKQADGQTHLKEAEQLIHAFLARSRASLGSTKSLVDLGGEGQAVLSFLTHLNQVGQTGSTPRHAKGLATCCHGEEPHTVGWRFIAERRAVNLDPNCGWARGKADVLYVADAFAVVAKLNELIAPAAG